MTFAYIAASGQTHMAGLVGVRQTRCRGISRGEAAALRTLANSARVLESQPVLAPCGWCRERRESGATVLLERPRL